MKIILNNFSFDYDFALKLLKSKFTTYENCNIKSDAIEEIWDSIIPVKFSEISTLRNIEGRRVAYSFYGTDKLTSSKNCKLLDRQIIKKINKSINPKTSKEVNKEYNDIYELYQMDDEKDDLLTKLCFVKCWCTSTNREYNIMVPNVFMSSHIDAIKAISWTFKINVKKEAIDYILRQGDCIFVKIKKSWENKDFKEAERSLEKEEYISKIKYES